jgi:gliding motility-associated lipoprotein GldB
MHRKILYLLLAVIVISCDSKSKLEKEIEQVPVDFEVVRFDQKFANVTAETLPQLKAEYPFLFPERFTDSVWLERINDSIQQELNTEVTNTFQDFTAEEDKLHSLFQHIKYYFPQFEAPTVITITSEVDYRNKVLLAEPYLFISLDTYLGKDHEFYLGIQEYLKKNFERNQILPDVAAQYAEKFVPQPRERIFLAHMIYYGKILYLKDIWLPDTGDHHLLGYTQDELQWAEENEEYIWRYFVEREVLYDTDSQLNSRFLYPAPFSKFYLELDNETPAMLGQYTGWKIVEQYMERTVAGIEEMLQADAETIFKQSNYKPRK